MIPKRTLIAFGKRYVELTGHAPSVDDLATFDQKHQSVFHVIQRHPRSLIHSRAGLVARKNLRARLRHMLSMDWPVDYLNQ